jgi:putative FmdB family regulatory protein
VPTYQYACTACTEQFEVVQKFTDDALTTCPSCEGSLRKVFSAVGIVFKGSGFYRTDNRSSGASSTAPASAETSKGSDDKPTKTEKKKETSSGKESSSTPAPAAASTST